jgi:hypothetical protein
VEDRENWRSLDDTPGQVGFAWDNKGKVVVEREIWGTRMAHRRSLHGTPGQVGFPGFPVESCGFEQLHVVLFEENHISGTG